MKKNKNMLWMKLENTKKIIKNKMFKRIMKV